jgi:hypothetical protein
LFIKIRELLINLSALFFPSGDPPLKQESGNEYYKLVEQARREWHSARQRFEEISDPDLVDSAIYAIKSAERRYVYLLRKAREEEMQL